MAKIRALLDKVPGYNDDIHSICMYLVMGILTTFVNVISFWFFSAVVQWDYRVANGIAWILSVLFAYLTNKRYVFNSYTPTWEDRFREIVSFFGFRFLTFIIDMALMIVFISWANINETLAKIVTNIIVLALNYIFSKLFIFRIESNQGKK